MKQSKITFLTVSRYTGAALSYNIAYTVAALIPLGVNYVYGVLQNPNYLIWAFIFLASLAIISTLTLQIKNHDECSNKSEDNIVQNFNISS